MQRMKNTARLLDLIETLRGENGCPWDRKQTPESVARHLSEEVYELTDAIELDDVGNICDELGDVLFLLCFIASFYKERGSFDIEKAAGASLRKMTRRHPHIFGESKLETPDQVLKQWREIKGRESGNEKKIYIAASVTPSLPPLARAHRLSERAAAAGFDWDDISGPMEKVEEEWNEFRSELRKEEKSEKRSEKTGMEFGDILFSLVNVARFAKIHPETALAASIRKFENRLTFIEKSLLKKGEKIETASKDDLEKRWEEAKQNE